MLVEGSSCGCFGICTFSALGAHTGGVKKFYKRSIIAGDHILAVI
jgi:hypothetical protein